MSAPQQRPRIVTIALWCWLVAAALLIALGLLSVTARNVLFFVRGAGVLFIVAALALAFLAGRTAKGDARYRRATVALALALVVLLALYTLLSQGIAWVVPMVLVMVAAVLMMRPSAHAWFSTGDRA
jgi:CDP-diglyceride synthetase